MGHDLGQADPALFRRGLLVPHGAPFLGLEVVGHQLHGVLRIVLPLPLDGHPEGVADLRDPFEAEADLVVQQLRGQADLVLDLALGVHVVDRVRDDSVGAALGSHPEAALAVQRDAFHVELLRRHAVAGDRQGTGDARRGLRRVDGEDRRLVAIETVVDGVDHAILARHHAGVRTPADQLVRSFGGDLRIGGRGILVFVDHHVRPHAAVLDQVRLVGGDEEVALRDGDGAFGRDAGGQELPEHRLRRVGGVVDRDGGGPLAQHEGVGRPAEGGEFHAFRLHALRVGPLVGVVAGLDDRRLEVGAALEDLCAVLGEDGNGAGAAVHVTLVRQHEVGVVQPLHAVGLAQAARLLAVEHQRGAVVLGVNAGQVHGTGGEVRHHRVVRADHHDVVVFLQGDDDLAQPVHVDEFRLRVLARDPGQAGHIDPDHVAVHRAVLDHHLRDPACRHLRHAAIACILVALVLDRGDDEGARIVMRGGIGLAAQVAFAGQLAGGKVHRHQLAARLRVGFGGVHADVGGVADHRDGGRFAAHFGVAHGLRRPGIGDVDAAHHAQRAVGVDQRHAVVGGGDDLGGGLALRVLALGHVQRGGKGGNAVEIHLAVAVGKGRAGRQRQCAGQADRTDGHVMAPVRMT